MNRPNITITAPDMLRAQGVKLSKAQMRQISTWADAVAAKRIARGEDADDSRPTRFNVPVNDVYSGALLGHIAYAI